MSWTADKLILTNALTGYTEIQRNLKVKESTESKVHKSYTIILGQPEITQLTNSNELDVRRVILEINYRQKSNTEYDANVELFEALKVVIAALSPFNSFIALTYPERWDEKAQQTTAKIEMFYGIRID